ncbi:MAG: hypothetical protein QMD85_01790 [Candidatus Aenigmarchaeota archaeon]|nr:hypothetical protein [Candidatus Aenigmarchaeota archaeon]MDI6722285.1 hypothetical protein [Candidatus Aenigmarchaeota archaeon]
MSKYLRYKTDEEKKKYIEENREIFVDGIGDLFFGLCRLANQLGIDIEEGFEMAKGEFMRKYSLKDSESKPLNK